jgi:hypothetical protein
MLFASGVAVTQRTLAGVDLAIIGVYFLIVFGIGFYFSRKERTSEDYFLASRNIGWFAIGASLFVSNISTEHFIGLAGSGATSRLAAGNFEWLACLILLLWDGSWCRFTCDRMFSRCRSFSSQGSTAAAAPTWRLSRSLRKSLRKFRFTRSTL